MTKPCITCGKVIPYERLDALPHTETCINCSTEEMKLGFTSWDKKTPELIISNNIEQYQKYDRAGGRLGRLK